MEIYVLTNDALPGLIKVGMTTKNADERADTLGSSAAVPEDFEVARSYKFPENISYQQLLEVERKAHNLLSEHRYSNRKEFFTCTTEYAGTVIEQLQREATDFLSRGLTITGQPRQATILPLLQGDKGRKRTLFDKPKIRTHWHVWTSTSHPETRTTTLEIIAFTYWTKQGATSRAKKEKALGKYSVILICHDHLCPDHEKNGPKETP